ncbi:MAG: hypothetical protein MJ072_00375 [Clostridia bacterium]|nr:hypothetical protein [Clostridia bacterium]
MDEKQQSKRSRFITGIVMLMSLIFTLIAVTFAWYTMSTDANVNKMSIRLVSDLNIQIAVDGGYSGEAEAYVGETRLKPMVGNGLNFFIPESYNEFGVKIGEIDGVNMYAPMPESLRAITDEEFENNVYEIEFSIRSSHRAKLYLGSQSTVENFSNNIADNISGATRIAIVKEVTSENSSLKCVWIPNSQKQLSVDNGQYVIESDGVPEESYTFYNSPTSFNTVSTLDAQGNPIANGSRIINNVTYIWGVPQPGLYFDNIGIGTTRYHLYLWVDGSDRECLSALMQGFASDKGDIEGGRVVVKIAIGGEKIEEDD